MKLCLVLALVLADAAWGERIEKRITGSTDCDAERQYHAEVTSAQRGTSCGGALLNTRWLVTASHCAQQKVKVKLAVNSGQSTLSKFWSFLKGSSKVNEQLIDTNQQFTYKGEDGSAHDITLIKLSQEVSAKLPTIKLPAAGCARPEVGHQVQVGGLGAKKTSGKMPSKVRCAGADIVQCRGEDTPGKAYFSDDATTMCAFKAGVESCYGDAGSAVEYDNLLHGIIVSNPADKCASTIVMLDICYYRKWIDETMQNNA